MSTIMTPSTVVTENELSTIFDGVSVDTCAWPGCEKSGHIRAVHHPPHLAHTHPDPAFCQDHYLRIEGRPFDGVILKLPSAQRISLFMELEQEEYQKRHPDPVFPVMRACLSAIAFLRGAIPNFREPGELHPFLSTDMDTLGRDQALYSAVQIGAAALMGAETPVFLQCRSIKEVSGIVDVVREVTFKDCYETGRTLFVPVTFGGITVLKPVVGSGEPIPSDVCAFGVRLLRAQDSFRLLVTSFVIPTFDYRTLGNVQSSVFTLDAIIPVSSPDQNVYVAIAEKVKALTTDGQLSTTKVRGSVNGRDCTENNFVLELLLTAAALVNIPGHLERFRVKSLSLPVHFEESYLQPKLVEVVYKRQDLFKMYYFGGLDGW